MAFGAKLTWGDEAPELPEDLKAAAGLEVRQIESGGMLHLGYLWLCVLASHSGSDTPPRRHVQTSPVTAPHTPTTARSIRDTTLVLGNPCST